ncbi:hypothetical protein Tco_0734226 [Tanacetum coccineum]
MQKNLALIAKYFKKLYKTTNNNLRTSSNTINKNVDTTLRYKNDNQSGQFGNQRTMTIAEARETVVEQSDWLADTDEEIDDQELKYIIAIWQRSRRELVDQAWVKHSRDHFRAPTAKDMEILIKTCLMPLALKTQNDSFSFVHELKQEMHADLKYIESLEDEIDELESHKAEFSNMYDMLLQECVSNDVMCSYLHSLSDLDAHTELQCLYLHKVKECECLAQKLSKQIESVSKEVYTELL